METSGSLIEMTGVCLRRSGKEILHNIDWRMRRNEHWAIIGANGSGKTTLLRIAGGTLFPSEGAVTVLGGRFGAVDMFKLRQRVGWVSSALLSRMPPAETAREIVVSGLRATFGLVYEYSDEDCQLAEMNLARVGIADRMDAPFGVLSQGEQQKTLFARAMMANPELYILDEACSGLDLSARESFLRVVDGVIAGRQAGLIMVTHHIEEIPPGITHALVLKNGCVLASGPVGEVISSSVLSDAFSMTVRVEQRNNRFWAQVQ